MTNRIGDILEKRFKELNDLQISTEDKRNKIKYNPSLREYYTNKKVIERYQMNNGTYSQPLLLRQYAVCTDTIDVDILESQNNIQTEFVKQSINLCTFTQDEIKYLIENHITNITLDKNYGIFQIFCDIDNIVHILKYFGDSISDNKCFFFTRFIIEDNIIPIFDNVVFDGNTTQKQVFLNL